MSTGDNGFVYRLAVTMDGSSREFIQLRVSAENHRKLSILKALLRRSFDGTLEYLLSLESPELDFVRRTIADMDGIQPPEEQPR